jgi:hypothetical protein
MKKHPPNFDVVFPCFHYISGLVRWAELFVLGIKV